MDSSEKDTLLLRQFNITQCVQIKLKQIKVPIGRARLQQNFQVQIKNGLTCAMCDFIGSSTTSLNRHLRIHEGVTLPTKVCLFCKKVSQSYSNNYQHIKTCKMNPKSSDETWVAQQKLFKCELCAFATENKNYIELHLIRHTKLRTFQCRVCNKTLKTRGDLRKHQSRHSDNKTVPCPLCPKLFFTKTDLKQHIPTHTREKPFKCHFCEKSLTRNGILKAHLIICKENPKQMDKDWVEKMKKYTCQLCNFASVTKRQLTSHFRTHTGEKPFHCGLCNYKCTKQGDLNGHVRVHTGEKPFNCSQCTYMAASSSTITTHFKRKHSAESGQKDVVCSLCSKRYYRRAYLERHMKLQHEI